MHKPSSIRSPKELRILAPTAILGYGFPVESFKRGLSRRPHVIAVDAGSTDPGPYYLGSGKPFVNRDCVKRDLEMMLNASVKAGIPVIIGTAGGSGARPHLQWCQDIVLEIAREGKLSFRLGCVRADVTKSRVLRQLEAGNIQSLQCVDTLTAEAVRASTNIVAQMGPEPLITALREGCDVVLAGRCYDPACFAALPIMLGYDQALSLHMGKILECAAIAATPGSGADCVLGTLRGDAFILETLSPHRRFTPQSTAAHTLYEKSDPYHLPGPGGEIDLTHCEFRGLKGGKVEVRGSIFVPTDDYWVKLEAARPIGFRSVSIAGTRDPIMISRIDQIVSSVDQQVRASLASMSNDAKIHYHIYGKHGVMGPGREVHKTAAHELGVVIEALAGTQEQADAALALARSFMLHYGYPGRISTAGNLAFPFSPSDISAGRAYEFSIYHLMKINSQDMFKIDVSDVKRGRA